MDIENGVAIVTGSSSGVGAACARQLAERGCHVAINYSRNAEGARETEAACQAFGVETVVVKANVANDDECRALADAALEKWGRVDALVNNAGTTKFNPHDALDGLSKQDFLDIYAVNTVGAYQMARAVVPAMKRGGRGSIVNVASIAAVTGVGSSIAYAASKGAMVTLTLSLARGNPRQRRLPRLHPRRLAGTGARQRTLRSRQGALGSHRAAAPHHHAGHGCRSSPLLHRRRRRDHRRVAAGRWRQPPEHRAAGPSLTTALARCPAPSWPSSPNRMVSASSRQPPA